jgi:uncharacterized repeat protein (TIGR03803 family)
METNPDFMAGSSRDGANPYAGLVQGNDGDFYGTTDTGGTNRAGTVFRISPSGSYSNLYSFEGHIYRRANPYAGLVQGSDGDFYGTTDTGGTNKAGTVFRITPGGRYMTLYSFAGPPNDGSCPQAGLVLGGDGNFYGTTLYGGASGVGTVFRISPSGRYMNLYSFGGSPNDGVNPYAGLVLGSDGNFYGTTLYGGANDRGAVFRVSPSGRCENLHSFAGSPDDGSNPSAGLVLGSDGNFYGTTDTGGANGKGTVFRINPGGRHANLYSFGVAPTDGENPSAGLVLGGDGNFYGTTDTGGKNGKGTVFRVSPSGRYTNLYSFAGSPTDGENPYAGLVRGSDGNFYGTTLYGGTKKAGTIFRISPGGSYTNLYSFTGSTYDGSIRLPGL